MSLPFLNTKKIAGLIVERRKPDVTATINETDDDAELEAIVGEFIEAIISKDVRKAATALRAAFMSLDNEPHNEGPHTEEDSE